MSSHVTKNVTTTRSPGVALSRPASADFVYSTVLKALYLTVSGPVIPISDVRGVNSSVYSKGERILRCKLASVYRLMDLNGWTSGIYNHITVSVSHLSRCVLLLRLPTFSCTLPTGGSFVVYNILSSYI